VLKYLLAAILSAFCCGLLTADDIKSQDKDLSDLIGRVFLTLSKDNVVAGQGKGVVSLWVNAKTGDVQEPVGKGLNSGTRLQRELVPDSDGIVLYFYGPYNPRQVQKVWTAWHNAGTRHFEFTLPASKGFIGVQGWYGDSFSREMVNQILALSPQPVPEQ
jgi:hypothetical protein